MPCVFNQEWLDETLNSQFSSWIKPLKDRNRVLCCFCQRSLALSNMGKRALESHMNNDKHKRNMSAKVLSISSYFKKPTAQSKMSVPNSADTDIDTQASCAEINRIPVASQMLTHFVRKDDVLKGEILWALKVIESNFSYNSSRNIVDLLRLMLPDRKIVEKLCLGSTKLAYLITHGLAPFFHDELLKLISSKYVIYFDEAFNEISKKEQMDIVTRFWDSSVNKVCSGYLKGRKFRGNLISRIKKKWIFRENLILRIAKNQIFRGNFRDFGEIKILSKGFWNFF